MVFKHFWSLSDGQQDDGRNQHRKDKGYIVFTESTQGSEAGIAKFTAHEFAHAWFSNANATSEHRRLDESTAEYVALRYVKHALGGTAVDEMLASKTVAAENARAVQGNRVSAVDERSRQTALKRSRLRQPLAEQPDRVRIGVGVPSHAEKALPAQQIADQELYPRVAHIGDAHLILF